MTHQIIRLYDHFQKDTIKNMKESLPKDFETNGLAVIISSGDVLKMNKDLMALSVKGISSYIRELKVYQPYMPEGDHYVDDKSRLFMLKYLELNSYLFNCYSFSQEKFTNIENFDRFELKQRLENLINIL